MRAAADEAERSFPFFAQFVTTVDENEPDPKGRVKRLPVYEKPFLYRCCEIMQDELLLWTPKSRRMFMTWLHSAELVWRALQPNSHLFIQTKKEDDADWLIKDRVWVIWQHLPEWLKYFTMGDRGTEARYKYCKLTLPNGSKIWGVAQGPDQFRGFTPTGVFSDEVAYQDEFEDAHTALLPLSEKGCALRFVSSARPSYFGQIVSGDKISNSIEEEIEGVREWELVEGGHVMRVHYSADPVKGKRWVKETSAKYPGGTEGSKWMQEMEIDFKAYAGSPIYPEFSHSKHVVTPLTHEFLAAHKGPYWRAMDYGLRNPTVCLFITEWENEYIVFDEYYQPGEHPIEETKKDILRKSAGREYKATWIDPRSDRHEVTDSFSPFYRLNAGEYGIGAQKANSSMDGIDTIKQWLFEGRLKVTSNCVKTIEEFENYKYEDYTDATQKKHNLKEKPLKVDDHTMDALRYFANGVLHREYKKPAKVVPLWQKRQESRRERILNPPKKRYAGSNTIMKGYVRA